MRRESFFLFIAAFLLPIAQSALPGDGAAFHPLPDPILLYVAVDSPEQLLNTADRLFQAAVEGTPLAENYIPGMFRALVDSKPVLGSIAKNNTGCGIAVISESQAEDPAVAYILGGTTVEEERTRLAADGFTVTGMGNGYAVSRTAPWEFNGLLYELDASRCLLVQEERNYSRFASALEGWRFDSAASRDIRVMVNGRRVRKLFANEIKALTSSESSAEMARRAAAGLPAGWDADARRGFGEAAAGLGKRFIDLALEVEQVELALRLRDEVLEIALDIAPAAGSTLGRYREKYFGRRSPDGKTNVPSLARAIADDAIFASCWRGGDTLFSDGDILRLAAFSLVKPLLAEKGDIVATLENDFAANPPVECVRAWHVGESGPFMVGYDRVPDGRRRAESLLKATEVFDAIVERLHALYGTAGPRIRVGKESGRNGAIAYRRVFLDVSGKKAATPPEDKVEDFLAGLSLYLAASRDTAVTVFGMGIDPETLGEMVARLGKNAGRSLWGAFKPGAIFSRLNTPDSIGQTVSRPSAILVNLMRWSETMESLPPGTAGKLRDNGDFTICRLAARPDTLGVDIRIPVGVLNDMTANCLKISATVDGDGIAGEKKSDDSGEAPPRKNGEKGSGDDWGDWGGDVGGN